MNRFMLLLLLALMVFSSHRTALALDCPKMPEQSKKDWEAEVNAAVLKIGPVKGGELKTKTKNTTMDLLSKLPQAGRIYLEQMMYSSYCSALRDDKSINESEKAKILRDYNREIRKTMTISPTSSPKSELKPSKKQIKGDNKPKAELEPADRTLNFTSQNIYNSPGSLQIGKTEGTVIINPSPHVIKGVTINNKPTKNSDAFSSKPATRQENNSMVSSGVDKNIIGPYSGQREENNRQNIIINGDNIQTHGENSPGVVMGNYNITKQYIQQIRKNVFKWLFYQ